jgi:hypothetical protein
MMHSPQKCEAVFSWALNTGNLDRVEMDIAAQSQKVVVAIHQFCFETSIKKVSMAVMPQVIINGIRRGERLHELREISLGSLKNQVRMVSHADKHIQADIILLYALRQTE